MENPKGMYFKYGKKEITYLSQQDRRLAHVIEQYGKLKRKVIPDIFEALVLSIISQQISGKAAATVTQRFRDLCGDISAEMICNIEAASIQQCGMSFKKAGYIKTVANAFAEGTIDPGHFPDLDDEAIIAQLVQLPGIGRWTAEMLLLHSLQRPDVFSYHDLAIRRGLMSLHNLRELTKADFEKYRRRYSPYCSIAMIYLWKHSKP